MKVFKILILVVFTFILIGCGKDNEEDPIVGNQNLQMQEFELFVDFWNPSGQNPQIKFDEDESSPFVTIDFEDTFGGFVVPPNMTNVVIDNVRIIGPNNVNFTINDITAFEYRDEISGWREDAEFVMTFEPVEDIDIIMVLDESASLGIGFENVQDYAQDFIQRIFNEMPNARIGIVSFADEINSIGLTNDQSLLNDYIDNMAQGQFTKLYDAMSYGIDLLNLEQTTSKVLLTFTDGVDNNSTPLITPEHILLKLDTPLGNNAKVNSFIIGLEGNGTIDQNVLNYLTANGGVAEFPTSMAALEDVFIRFSRSITNVYKLTYIRNQQQISITNPVRLRFLFDAVPE